MTTPNQSAVTLLDETDVVRRPIQHGTILAGIAILASAAPVADRNRLVALSLIAAGLVALVLAAFVRQRWDVHYKGHRISFVNNPLLGEFLMIDDVRVAKGRLGRRSELRAPLSTGETVAVTADAGLVKFRCRVLVEAAGAPVSTASFSDDQLRAEMRRRGIQT